MNVPFDNTRRLEDLERRLAETERALRMRGRESQAKGQRWTYFARTVREYGGEYPAEAGSNTFHLIFCDRQFTPTPGEQTVVDLDRSDSPQAVGTTVNGQWVMEDELVIALPAPPPPGSTGKGRWHILPLKTYYWGILEEDLDYGSVADVAVHVRIAGVWTDTTFTQPVRDRLLHLPGQKVDLGTWVKFGWETDAWLVEASACGPPPEA